MRPTGVEAPTAAWAGDTRFEVKTRRLSPRNYLATLTSPPPGSNIFQSHLLRCRWRFVTAAEAALLLLQLLQTLLPTMATGRRILPSLLSFTHSSSSSSSFPPTSPILACSFLLLFFTSLAQITLYIAY